MDGMKGSDVVINSVCQDSNNSIWWGTGKGLTMLRDSIKLQNSEPPVLQLNYLTIGQEFIDFRRLSNDTYRESLTLGDDIMGSFETVVPFRNYPQSLSLRHNLDHISFHFSAIDWTAPHKIRYQYILEGQDESWSQLNEDIMAEYRNLGFGEYLFKVKAIGASNEWSETFEYPFKITRPWWYRWWAFVLYLLIGTVVIINFDRWRTNRVLKKQQILQLTTERRNQELERLVAERTIEIKRQQELTERANFVLEQKVKERTQELIEKNKKLSDYAFLNAHNVRVPVANIKGIIQLFEADISFNEKIELISLLKGESNNLDKVLYEIKDMLEKDNSLENW
jgi:signal transduction histidine kinase